MTTKRAFWLPCECGWLPLHVRSIRRRTAGFVCAGTAAPIHALNHYAGPSHDTGASGAG
jgi:hypothetical protein